MGIDDAVGAVAVHGVGGAIGVLAMGIFAAGYPNMGDAPATSFFGQLVGLVTFIVLGFVPGYLGSLIFKVTGTLRVPDEAQIVGLDTAEVPLGAYGVKPGSSATGQMAPGAAPAE